MAETESPNPNGHLAATYCHTQQVSGRRKWSCPADPVIAAYLDGSLTPDQRNRIQSHVVNCDFCRSLIGQIVRTQRSQDPLLPPGLLQRAIRQTKSQSKHLAWSLIPAAALMSAVLVFAILMLRTSLRVAIPSPPPPVAPEIAMARPEPLPRTPVPETVRKPVSIEQRPHVISPRFNAAVEPAGIEFRWSPVPQTHYYQVRLTSSDGDLIWETQSEATDLRLPASVDLKNGTYFVWILAQLVDGQVRKSPAVLFRVTASR